MTKSSHLRFLVAAIDSLFALALAATAVLWAEHRYVLGDGAAQFLAIRITLLNACLSTVFAFTWINCWEFLGLYRRGVFSVLSLLLRTLAATTFMALVLGLFLQIAHTVVPVGSAIIRFFLAILALETGRVLLSSYTLRWHLGEPERVLILGTGRRAGKAWRELRTRHHSVKQFLGFFDDRDRSTLAPDIEGRYLGCIDKLSEYLLLNVVDEIIIATPMRSCYDLTQRAISIAEAAGVRITCLNDFFSLSYGTPARHPLGLFFGLVKNNETHEWAGLVKRTIDVVAAAVGLVVLAPLFLMIGVCVKLTSPGPVFFTQERYGFGRRRFRMYKFRSMVRDAPQLLVSLEAQNEASGPIFKMKNDPRVTPFGRFLRSSSLDELPQLWNVLVGDMSLVGPRPMSVRDVSLFSEAQLMRRFSVLPGITGSWQIAGRSSLSFDEWMALDSSYIDGWSLGLDLKILARTVPAVLKRHGAV